MKCLTFSHTVFPTIIAFVYLYFILLMNHILWLSILLLTIFFILFILYNLAIYSLFHHQPGYETYQTAQSISMDGKKREIYETEVVMPVDKIGQYKQNQRRMLELIVLMRENISFQQLHRLREEYIERYQQPSFCNTCQIIKSPRTFHCKQCDKCILRRQKHSQLVGKCIGAKNMKIFIQYLFISMILSLYMVVSLILISILENNKLDDFSDAQLSIFAVFEIVMGAAVLLFGKQFFISYFNALDNITETQRKLDIITKNNNPFKNQQYYSKMFHTNLDLFKIQDIADPNNWLAFNEQHEPNESN